MYNIATFRRLGGKQVKYLVRVTRPFINLVNRNGWVLLAVLIAPIIFSLAWGFHRSDEMASGWEQRQGTIIHAGTQPVSDSEASKTKSTVRYRPTESSARSLIANLPWQLREGDHTTVWFKADQATANNPTGLHGVILVGFLMGFLATFLLFALMYLLDWYIGRYDAQQQRHSR